MAKTLRYLQLCQFNLLNGAKSKEIIKPSHIYDIRWNVFYLHEIDWWSIPNSISIQLNPTELIRIAFGIQIQFECI